MATVQMGDKVQLHFTGRLSDGTVFESSQDAGDFEWQNFRGTGVAFAPMTLVVGSGEMLPAFEEKLIGLEPGARTTFTIPCERAFGPRRDELVTVIPREEITPAEQHLQTFRLAEGRRHPNHFNPKIGGPIDLTAPDGTVVSARVRALDDETITVDSNHPLAGQDLVFDVRLFGIVG